MAKTKKSHTKKGKKHSAKTTGPRPIKTKLTKKQLVNHIALVLDGDPPSREVRTTVTKALDELSNVMARSVMPGGIGTFMLPKMLKINLKTRKAIKKGTLVRSPATGEMVPAKGRPESQTVKVRPLTGLKKAAAGEL